MSRRVPRRPGTHAPAWGSAGFDALRRATDLLAAGDKLGALRAYGQAFNALYELRHGTAPEGKRLAGVAIEKLVAELGHSAFGPDLCDHGQSKNLGCWACSVATETAPATPSVAKTEPTEDDLTVVFGYRRERAADAEVIRDMDEELLRKAGG